MAACQLMVLRRGVVDAAAAPLPCRPLPTRDADSRPLLQLGAAAFFDYPAQLVSGFELLLRSPEQLAGYGLWQAGTHDAEDAARAFGALRIELPGNSGTFALALSCASCRPRRRGADRCRPAGGVP